MSGKGMIAAILVLTMLASPVVFSDEVAAVEASEYESPFGVYMYTTTGFDPDTYSSEVVALSGCTGTVVVQSAIEGYPLKIVTSLSGCTADTLVMPASITYISNNAFSECIFLDRIYFLGNRPVFEDYTIPDEVDVYVLEGTLGWDHGTTNVLDLKVYSGAGFSFEYYVIDGEATVHRLINGTDITIPSEILGMPVISIGAEAFMGTGISSLKFEEGVDTIGVRAFYNCESLLNVTLPNTLRIICDEAFRYNIKLNDINLRNTEFIGFETFRMCHNFKEIVIPDMVTSMRGGSFYVCDSVKNLVIGSGISKIEERAFGYGSSISDLTIMGNITSVGNDAFYNCKSLPSISLKQVTDIGRFAFYMAESLSEIDLGDQLTSIGDKAFWKCKALTKVCIPETLVSMGENAFSECSSLESIVIPNGVTHIGDWSFYRCYSLESVVIPNSITSIGISMFNRCSSLTSVIIGNSVTSIEDNAFKNCSKLTSIDIPDSVKSIGDQAFSECSFLTDVYFKGEMPLMGKNVFHNSDVTAHYLTINGESWENYDGRAVSDSDLSINYMVVAISILVVVVIVIVISYLLIDRRKK